MKAMLHCMLEAHATAATLYLRGTLSTSGSLLALRCCEELPRSIRTLRVDLSGVELFHPTAVQELFAALDRWRQQRDGVTRLDVAGRREARMCVLGRVAESND